MIDFETLEAFATLVSVCVVYEGLKIVARALLWPTQPHHS